MQQKRNFGGKKTHRREHQNMVAEAQHVERWPSSAGAVTEFAGDADVSARRWRAELPSRLRHRSTLKGLAYFGLLMALYVGLFVGSFWLPSVAFRFVACVAQGFVLGALMVLGHDAAHQSLTPVRWLNQLIARICFLPLYHPYTSWVHSHNWLHHGFTNLKGRHPDFAPMSKAEFDQAGLGRQLLERFYRTPVGVGLSYAIEFWLKHLLFPTGDRAPRGRLMFTLDRLLVLAFLVGQIWLASVLSASAPNRALSTWGLTVIAIGLPWASWISFMAIASFVQHTHPTIAWYSDEAQWRFFEAQIKSTTHMTMPAWMDTILLHIMDHAAHHIDPSIPLYHLTESQSILEQQAPAHAVVIPWSLTEYLRICRLCKLYDFERHQWLDFTGKPTTPLLVNMPIEVMTTS